jgi:1,4-dihydroxy-2-naphthoate polyprenyltransferase
MTTVPQPTTKLQAWYLATRPRVFTASFVPMGLAGVIAFQNGVFNLLVFVLSLLGVMLLQTGANLVNEYADFKRGADELKQAGQGMTIKNNLLSPQEVLLGAVLTIVGGALIGLFLLFNSGIWLLWIGMFGVLVAIFYTAGPFPFAYNGLGEITVGIAMGPMIVIGAYYVMYPSVTADMGVRLGLISLPITFMVANILHANNVRDIEADRAVNKRTLAVIFGLKIARIEYKVLSGLTYASLAILVLFGWMPITTLLAFITLPEALTLIRIIDHDTDPQKLHMAQGRTARLHGRIGLLIVLGWVLWLVLDQLI